MSALQVVSGSIGDVARTTGKSVAESFVSADAIILVDVSGSMSTADAGEDGRTQRFTVALRELAVLQKTMPGRLAVIGFSDDQRFFPGGQPLFDGGGTDLKAALHFAKVADVPGMRFVVICDGCPDDEAGALAVASTYKNRIDTIFVGNPHMTPAIEFLKKLASVGGGQHVDAAQVKALAQATTQLLLA